MYYIYISHTISYIIFSFIFFISSQFIFFILTLFSHTVFCNNYNCCFFINPIFYIFVSNPAFVGFGQKVLFYWIFISYGTYDGHLKNEFFHFEGKGSVTESAVRAEASAHGRRTLLGVTRGVGYADHHIAKQL